MKIKNGKLLATSSSRTLFDDVTACPDEVPKEEPKAYNALSSVWERSEGELLEAMLSFYPTIEPYPILDATYNTGRIWRGTSREVVSMDIDPRCKPMILGDNRVMEGVILRTLGRRGGIRA
jgi:hypothetical protein